MLDDCMIYIAYAVAVAIRGLLWGGRRGGCPSHNGDKKRVAGVLTYQHIPVSPLLHVVDQFSLCLEVARQMFDHLVVQCCE